MMLEDYSLILNFTGLKILNLLYDNKRELS